MVPWRCFAMSFSVDDARSFQVLLADETSRDMSGSVEALRREMIDALGLFLQSDKSDIACRGECDISRNPRFPEWVTGSVDARRAPTMAAAISRLPGVASAVVLDETAQFVRILDRSSALMLRDLIMAPEARAEHLRQQISYDLEEFLRDLAR
jgi:hypothetical protein